MQIYVNQIKKHKKPPPSKKPNKTHRAVFLTVTCSLLHLVTVRRADPTRTRTERRSAWNLQSILHQGVHVRTLERMDGEDVQKYNFYEFKRITFVNTTLNWLYKFFLWGAPKCSFGET